MSGAGGDPYSARSAQLNRVGAHRAPTPHTSHFTPKGATGASPFLGGYALAARDRIRVSDRIAFSVTGLPFLWQSGHRKDMLTARDSCVSRWPPGRYPKGTRLRGKIARARAARSAAFLFRLPGDAACQEAEASRGQHRFSTDTASLGLRLATANSRCGRSSQV